MGKLYRNPNLAEDVTVLLTGVGKKEKQPVAWTRTWKKGNGERCFYTSMEYPHDFENENFMNMLVNAIFWIAKRNVEGE